ncbi:sugar porter family MFS transporter [Amnibacterium kyonggiense]|uniref:SP family sugar:H+ symporter-like MFS transporter n=1 Tax=Amnibacterium kyonggiense TaxID=595671 RepID=A0A4R7FRW2_9MICO|nr:sugar porter family MFS transporter [Amnibacterium kyonggiense]TDS80575.1 SP family sugar:H+ symporter-like MFS transporter [Amnibacterium kyonggiense]
MSGTQQHERRSDASAPGRLRRKVTGLAVAGALGGFLFGFDSSVVNGAVDAIGKDFKLSATLQGFAVAVALLGCAVGAYLAGRIADRFGRTRTMLVGAILFLVSSLGAGLAFGVGDFMFWRIVGGLGIGVASVVSPTYIAEVVPASVRGRLGSLQQLAITVGIFAALLSDALFAGFNGSTGASQTLLFGLEAWRWMFLVGVVPSIAYGVIALRLPESPRHLLAKQDEGGAREVLRQTTPIDVIDDEVRDIRRSIEQDEENAKKGSLRGPVLGLQPVVWAGIVLSVLQQFVGINVIFYYSTTLWNAVGFKDSFAISVFSAVLNVAVTFIAIAIVDKVGRRPMLLAGSAGMTIALAAVAISFSQAQTGANGAVSLPNPWGVVALIGANLFVICFGATWGPLVWVLLGEMFPNRIRAKALGVAAAAQWIANFAVTLTFPPLSQLSLPVTYGLYTLFALVSLLFVFFLIPETKGVSLEDMGGLAFGRKARLAAKEAARS